MIVPVLLDTDTRELVFIRNHPSAKHSTPSYEQVYVDELKCQPEQSNNWASESLAQRLSTKVFAHVREAMMNTSAPPPTALNLTNLDPQAQRLIQVMHEATERALREIENLQRIVGEHEVKKIEHSTMFGTVASQMSSLTTEIRSHMDQMRLLEHKMYESMLDRFKRFKAIGELDSMLSELEKDVASNTELLTKEGLLKPKT